MLPDQRFWKRALAAFSLVAHLVLVGAGPLADARLELAELISAKDAAHVEDANLPSCARHQHATCLVCRTLQNLDVPGIEKPIATFAAPSTALRRVGRRSSVRTDGWLTSVSPRAPPHDVS